MTKPFRTSVTDNLAWHAGRTKTPTSEAELIAEYASRIEDYALPQGGVFSPEAFEDVKEILGIFAAEVKRIYQDAEIEAPE